VAEGGDVVSQHATDERTALLAVVSAPRDGLLLRTREVAVLFQVSERAVTEWARRGRIASVRTPGGHRRYPAEQVRQLLGIEVDGEV
jgi:excisionase family DNA binding protein